MRNEKLRYLGINIKSERLKKGISQEKLAEMTNISLATVSLIETGKQNTSVLNIINIADALGVKLDSLFTNI